MTSPDAQEHVADIIRRLYLVTETSGPADLARALGLSDRSVVSNWKRRGTVPVSDCLRLARERDVSLDWLLTGDGQMRREAPVGVAEAANQYGEGTAKVEAQDPPDLAEIIAALRSWHAAASEEDRIWMRVQIRRAIPEIEEHIRSIQARSQSN